MTNQYLSLEQLLARIDSPNHSICRRILEDNLEIFRSAKGSRTKHHAWEGGYLDHLKECMNLSLILYKSMDGWRKLPFSESDALLMLFLHDLEKPWKYAAEESDRKYLSRFKDYQDFVTHKVMTYGFVLNEDHWNCLRYVHGEGSDYNPTERVQSPLAAFVHTCDTLSARIWYDQPISVGKAAK
jgi:hypothetical protein